VTYPNTTRMIDAPPEEVSLAIQLVEEATRIALKLSKSKVNGSEEWVARIDDLGDEPSFSICMTTTPYRGIAALIPDTFAGAFLHNVCLRARDAVDTWDAMVEESAKCGTRVALSVNGSAVTVTEAISYDWQFLEIEGDTKFSEPRSARSRGHALASSFLGVLSLFIACSEDDDTPGDEEGRPVEERSVRYERSRANRIRCLNFHGFDCVVCGFNFESAYGSLGRGFVEVHHLFAVAAMPPGYRPDPTSEMVPLCANCHRMAHTTTPPTSPEVLREALGKCSK